VLKSVRENLLTPCGLRTLAPDDPAYRGSYGGNTVQRDGAYHQGTVWPWLLGAFGEATLKYAKDKDSARAFLREYLRNFLGRHLREAGLGSVSEIFDGDAPHAPRGCIAQAWSVGEIIRLYHLLQDA
jgi:glycogen debranching enzyme